MTPALLPFVRARGPLAAMRAECDARGWPVSYRSDLRHDVDALAMRSDAAPFAWFLSPLGTHLVFPFPSAMLPRSEVQTRAAYIVAGSLRPASALVRNVSSTMDARGRWFLWDGLALAPATIDEAAAFCDAIESANPAEVR